MARFGISGNLMSLGAIDFGLIIDGAVVVVKNIVRQMGQRQHSAWPALTVEERANCPGSEQTGRSPMFLWRGHHHRGVYPDSRAHGIEGKNVSSMALTVMLALTGALL